MGLIESKYYEYQLGPRPLSKQDKLERREMKFYKKHYPGVVVECRGPSYPGALVYPLGTRWVSVIIEDTPEFKEFLKDFKNKFHVQDGDA